MMQEPKSSLGAGVIPLDPRRTRYTLTSGKVVDVLPGKGKHLRLAGQMLGAREDQASQNFALAAVLCRLDGVDLTIEDIEELDMLDAAELCRIVRGEARSDEQKAAAADPKASPEPSPSSPDST